MKALRQAWGTRIGLPAANWMLEIGTIFLRTETELALKSRRVIPGRLVDNPASFSVAALDGESERFGVDSPTYPTQGMISKACVAVDLQTQKLELPLPAG